ncbi:MAG TPA: glycosyltransferase family 4 protein, partial [Pirellulales bacterium]
VGSGDFSREYQAEVTKRPELKGRITFLEQVANVAPILQELDLLVMPSLWEACPILPMEAMVSGVPVLGTDCIGLREVLSNSPSVMVPANDPAALADALRRALEDSWKADAVGYVPAAQRRFDVQPVGQTLATLFASLVEAPVGRRPLLHEDVISTENTREDDEGVKEFSKC